MIGFNPNPEPLTAKIAKKEPGLFNSLVYEVQSRWIRADIYLLACAACFIIGFFAGHQ